MYTYNKKVLFSDIDANSYMSLNGILNAMQDCVNINSESIGKGIDFMQSTNRVWFAVSWNIQINRYPELFEDIVVKTWPYRFTSAIGFRNVVITDSKGDDIVVADSNWSLVDAVSGMPIKIESIDYTGYELEEKYPMEEVSRKIKLPKEFDSFDSIEKKTYEVVKSDLDFNSHMTNSKYIQLANDFVPLDVIAKRVRVEYKKQSLFGERLTILRYFDSIEKRYLIKFEDESKDVKAIVELGV